MSVTRKPAWEAQVQELACGALELRILKATCPLSLAEVLSLWQESDAFCSFFVQQLAGCCFRSFYWELPPVTAGALLQPFRCVLLDAPELSGRSPQPEVFAQELAQAGDSGVGCFPNLGGDALLVVPQVTSLARADTAAYGELASFVREAPETQRRELWRVVGRAMSRRLQELGDRAFPFWVSSSGLGVAWLHVRLDELPKYIVHAPYRLVPE